MKLQRSSIISQEIGNGLMLEDIDMTKVDTEFSNRIIKTSYEEIIKKLPTSEKMSQGTKIEFKGKSEFEIDLDFTVPEDPCEMYMECYPSKEHSRFNNF